MNKSSAIILHPIKSMGLGLMHLFFLLCFVLFYVFRSVFASLGLVRCVFGFPAPIPDVPIVFRILFPSTCYFRTIKCESIWCQTCYISFLSRCFRFVFFYSIVDSATCNFPLSFSSPWFAVVTLFFLLSVLLFLFCTWWGIGCMSYKFLA